MKGNKKSPSPFNIKLSDNSVSSKASLQKTWAAYAKNICCINTYANGLTISLHDKSDLYKSEKGDYYCAGDRFHLRNKDTKAYRHPEGRSYTYRNNPLKSLERHLVQLRKKSILSSTVVYFGTAADPFLSFHKRFDITCGCLQLFEKYRPGLVVFQTRSPMIISALPTIKALGSQAAVSVTVESHLEKSIARYTPGMPKVAERLVAIQGLRSQGIKVNVSVSPVLPYGDFKRDAWDFAELLDSYSDSISLGCLATGLQSDERELKSFFISRKLEADKQYEWLRPQAHRYLFKVLEQCAGDKLNLPLHNLRKSRQMSLFAAQSAA